MTTPESNETLRLGSASRGKASAHLTRRRLLARAGGLVTALTTLELLHDLARVPQRAEAQEIAALPDIQFDIGRFITPPQDIDGVRVQFPPVNTTFVTAQLRRVPNRRDQQNLANALATIESRYPFRPSGIFVHVAYGVPYFNKLPGGLVAQTLPRLQFDQRRFVLERAVPGPTDVHPNNPPLEFRRREFTVPVVLESNDLLFTLRSDRAANISDVLNWLNGSNRLAGAFVPSPPLRDLLTFTSSRAMFVQIGLPRRIADANRLVFSRFLNPRSPMWMGFADQQVEAFANAPDVTFAASTPQDFTTARPGDYFDNGSIQHLSHLIQDMRQFFDIDSDDILEPGEPADDGVFLERVQYMFRSNPPPSQGNEDPLTDGGGPAFLPAAFQGNDDAANNARGIGTPENERRMGHISNLQRVSRTARNQPLHIRIDGPGFDNMDVPRGTREPKLQFSIFVPTADFFQRMREAQASLDFKRAFDIPEEENGLERFLTATRRQNFLIPPRRHRSFPLVEFT